MINSERLSDPIAVHYSQPSLRMEWMFKQKPKRDDAWTKRSSSSDEDSPMRWLRKSYYGLLEDLGREYTFVTLEQIERGELVRSEYRVLILPRSTALSEAEAHAMRAFVEQGGVLIANGSPGTYEARGRRLSTSYLSELFGPPSLGSSRRGASDEPRPSIRTCQPLPGPSFGNGDRRPPRGGSDSGDEFSRARVLSHRSLSKAGRRSRDPRVPEWES